MSFEVDPARLDDKDDISFFGAIVSSADKFPPQLRNMCVCLYPVLSKRYLQLWAL